MDEVWPSRSVAPDPHGEAALLLVESLIHHLVAQSALSRSDALEVVQTAIDVQADYLDERHDLVGPRRQHHLLQVIVDSLKLD